MNHQLIHVVYSPQSEYELSVREDEKGGMDKKQAQQWLSDQFEELECTPSNPMGKVLMLDMILNVAKYAGEERFRARGQWAQEFAVAVAAGLGRKVVRIDVPAFTVG